MVLLSIRFSFTNLSCGKCLFFFSLIISIVIFPLYIFFFLSFWDLIVVCAYESLMAIYIIRKAMPLAIKFHLSLTQFNSEDQK